MTRPRNCLHRCGEWFGKEEIADIVRTYGEERYAFRLANAIVAARKKKQIRTTGELVEVIRQAIGYRYKKQKLHPACRTFQALRIFVNDELGAVEEGVKKAISYLSPESRICVISFHSLEDRIIKHTFREKAASGEVTVLTKKPIYPGADEMRENPRSRSAKLRVAEKKA